MEEQNLGVWDREILLLISSSSLPHALAEFALSGSRTQPLDEIIQI